MAWRLTGDLDEFATAAGDFLTSRPVEHTVFLTVIDALRRRGRHTYGPQESLVAPSPPGRARVATPADRDLLLEWQLAFYAEIGERVRDDVAAAMDDRISYGGVLLWEDGGRPVAMAIRSRPELTMARVQIV